MIRVLVVVSVLVTSACGTGAAMCDARSCASGCCDSLGQCRSGTDRNTCGLGGALCTTCDLSQICSVGRCTASSIGSGGGTSGVGGGSSGGVGGGSSGGVGGGSSNVGGGSSNVGGGSSNVGGGSSSVGGGSSNVGGGSSNVGGGLSNPGGGLAGGSSSVGGGIPNGGGAPAGCTTFTQSFVTQTGGYSNVPDLDEITLSTRRTGTTGFFQQLDTRIVWSRENVPTNVVVPGVIDLSQGTYDTCKGCVTLRTCSATTACSVSLLARSGSLVVQTASRSRPGSFVATMHHVLLREWTLGNDLPVSGGQCVYLPSATVNVSFQ